MASLCMICTVRHGIYVALGLTACDTVIGISHLLLGEKLTASDQYAMARMAQLLDLPEPSTYSNRRLSGDDRRLQDALIKVLGAKNVDDEAALQYAATLKNILMAPDLPPSSAARETLERLSDLAASVGELMVSRTSARLLL